jgi:hypothetical protein
MKYILLIIFLFCFCLVECKKNSIPNYKIYYGTVIGFDPCTGSYTGNAKKGFVIKIDSVSEFGDTLLIDTVTTYNLPDIFTFNPNLFINYKFSYLFPKSYQDTFKFRFTFNYTPYNQKVAIFCFADIFTAPFSIATKGKQIVINKIY